MKRTILILLLIAGSNVYLIGQSWYQAAGIPQNEYIYDLASFNQYAFAATMSGIYRSTDYGQNWEPKNNGIPAENNFARALSKSGNRIYVANSNGVFVTEDDGENWQDLNIPNHTICLSVFADDSIVLAGVPGGGLYRSTDYGTTWEGVTADHIYKIAKKNNYYFASSWGDVVYSGDYGLTWQSSNFNHFSFWTFAMNDTIFACNADGGLEKTAPGNISWKPVDGISSPINGIAFKSDTLFAVSNDKVLYSKYNEMNSPWSELTTNGLPVFNNAILWSSTICGNYLMAGTSNINGEGGLGVWSIDLNEVFTSIQKINNKDAIQIYPNPAGSQLFFSDSQESVSVSIYDLQGKLLIDQKIIENNMEISSLSSGMYIIKVNSKNIFVTKNLIKI